VVEVQGRERRVVKGAFRTVAELAKVAPEEIALLEGQADEHAASGFRVLAVASAEGQDPLRLVGLALLHDPPRPDSRRLIAELTELGVAVKMLTGDALPVARRIAGELGLGEVVRAPELRGASVQAAAERLARAEGLAEVFPEDKFLVVKGLQAAGHVVGMTGDGVNDAPALRQAEVGIAVGGASDVAKGAASVVLTGEGLASIVDLVKNGRAIYQRVLTWIVNKVSRTILKAGFVVAAFLVTGKFVVSALAMVLLVFLTDFVKIALATDRVRPSPKPETWDIGPLIRVAVALGVLMLAEALVVLAIGWRVFRLADSPGRLQTFSFQILLFFALFSIVSIRERRAFWRSRPGTTLTLALVADGLIGLLIGVRGLAELGSLPVDATLFVLVTAALCSLGINDLVKATLNARLALR
jgi:magnesium-transporting ATPase (P-type)